MKPVKSMTFKEFEDMFPDEDACKKYLMSHRWPEKVKCPRCGNENVYELTREYHWQCHDCATKGYRFSVLVGTIFENTNYPLCTWFKVIYLMLSSKKGMSALQIHRMIGTGSYRTAWYMCHRIRAGLGNVEFRKLIGFVEVDETYVGGKEKNKHKDKRTGGGRGTVGKTPIIGAVSRKGKVVAKVIESVDTPTLDNFVRQTVSDRVSLVSTDDNSGYRYLGRWFNHGVVHHAKGEYVVGSVHTATIDGFWSMIKRGIFGTFHKVSKKYLQLYIYEFEFRYNNRRNSDIFDTAILGCQVCAK
ncbi:MAG: IS1595 family transposase [Syntrophales bacterium]|jgi:transposase-like protein